MTSSTSPSRRFREATVESGLGARPVARVRASRPVDHTMLGPRVAPRLRAVRAERTQRRAEELRAAWLNDRRELIASVSHELRTPLTSVVGYTEVLLSGDAGPLNAEQTMMLERVVLNGVRLLDLIKELVSATSECLVEGHSVDMAELVVDVVGGVQPDTPDA